MAETILRSLSKGAIDVESAGTTPEAEIHPMARPAIQKLLNLDMGDQRPTSVDRFTGQHFDYVITLCDSAAESCPIFPGDPERIHWTFADPAAVSGTDEAKQHVFDTTATQLVARIRLWLSLPALRHRLEQVASTTAQ